MLKTNRLYPIMLCIVDKIRFNKRGAATATAIAISIHVANFLAEASSSGLPSAFTNLNPATITPIVNIGATI